VFRTCARSDLDPRFADLRLTGLGTSNGDTGGGPREFDCTTSGDPSTQGYVLVDVSLKMVISSNNPGEDDTDSNHGNCILNFASESLNAASNGGIEFGDGFFRVGMAVIQQKLRYPLNPVQIIPHRYRRLSGGRIAKLTGINDTYCEYSDEMCDAHLYTTNCAFPRECGIASPGAPPHFYNCLAQNVSGSSNVSFECVGEAVPRYLVYNSTIALTQLQNITCYDGKIFGDVSRVNGVDSLPEFSYIQNSLNEPVMCRILQCGTGLLAGGRSGRVARGHRQRHV
jgi:hypothetical protein